jgi:uncharacterized membrane-anchored protein
MSKDAWAYIVDHVFSHEYSTIYHQSFLRLLLKVIELKDENLYVTVIICQNVLSKIANLYEDAFKAKEYGMAFLKHDLLTLCVLWVEITEYYLEKNDNFPGFSA